MLAAYSEIVQGKKLFVLYLELLYKFEITLKLKKKKYKLLY